MTDDQNAIAGPDVEAAEKKAAERLAMLQEERKFLEGLMQQRFNFLLVVFALILNAASNAKGSVTAIIYLAVGLVLCCLLWLTIYRIFTKVDATLELMHKHKEGKNIMHEVAMLAEAKHPCAALNREANQFIGIWVPLICTSSIGIILMLRICEWLFSFQLP